MSILIERKVLDLFVFYEYIYDVNYSVDCGEKYYKDLMKNYSRVTSVFLGLKKEY